MRLVLTGASGFLGSRVADLLAERGHNVVAIGRTAPAEGLRAAAEFFRVDLRDRGEVERAAADAGAVD